MRKGLATETILLLVLGILVVGIIVYLLYKYALTKELSAQECMGKLINICMQCKNMEWGNHAISNDITSDCSRYPQFSVWSDNTNCNAGSTQIDCQALGVQ